MTYDDETGRSQHEPSFFKEMDRDRGEDFVMNGENGNQAITGMDHSGKKKMIIEFQASTDLLEVGIIPFPLKRVEIESSDVIHINLVLNFFENVIREFWCKGKLKA